MMRFAPAKSVTLAEQGVLLRPEAVIDDDDLSGEFG
jgi:hypothetical protein